MLPYLRDFALPIILGLIGTGSVGALWVSRKTAPSPPPGPPPPPAFNADQERRIVQMEESVRQMTRRVRQAEREAGEARADAAAARAESKEVRQENVRLWDMINRLTAEGQQP